jgi:hypothetical protein
MAYVSISIEFNGCFTCFVHFPQFNCNDISWHGFLKLETCATLICFRKSLVLERSIPRVQLLHKCLDLLVK